MADPEKKQGHEFLVNASLRAAMALAEALPIKENDYQGIVGHAFHDARAYYLYGCMDEVLKVSTAAIRWLELLQRPEKPVAEPPDVPAERRAHMMRLVSEAIQDEQHMWIRKLNELLSDLIQFGESNSQDYYRLYLAATLLDAYLGLQQDFDEFFACQNANAAVSITELRALVREVCGRVGEDSVWFLRRPLKVDRAGQILTSKRSRFINSLTLASSGQKISLGVSYETGYSMPSRSIHASIGSPTRDDDGDQASRNLGHVAVLAIHIVVSAYRLAGIEPTGDARTLTKVLSDNDAPVEAFEAMHRVQHEMGDMVFAYGRDICLVVDRSESRYGYTSYKVRFLTKPMLEEVPEDWFPSRYVHRLLPRASLRQAIKGLLGRYGASTEEIAEVDAIEEPEMSERIAELVRQWEREGILDRLFATTTEK